MQTVGTCSICGGPVQYPMHWGGSTPPPIACAHCGAKPKSAYGPVIPMEKTTVEKFVKDIDNSLNTS